MIKQFEFIKNMDEPYVYKNIKMSEVIFLILYVDDISLIENDISLLQLVNIWLSNNFSMKDMSRGEQKNQKIKKPIKLRKPEKK